MTHRKGHTEKNIFSLGPIPKGIDSTLAFPSSGNKDDFRTGSKIGKKKNKFMEFDF